MAKRKPKQVWYRRKREGKTNYKKRLLLLLSQKPRLVVRFSNQRIVAQVVSFTAQGDKVIAAVDSSALAKLGWNYSQKNTPASYLTGLLLGKKALKALKQGTAGVVGATEVVVDTGLRSPQRKGKLYAFVKGVVDAGLQLPYGDESIFPDEARIKGEHIQAYAHQGKFTQYLKKNSKPEEMPKAFEAVKRKIMETNGK